MTGPGGLIASADLSMEFEAKLLPKCVIEDMGSSKAEKQSGVMRGLRR